MGQEQDTHASWVHSSAYGGLMQLWGQQVAMAHDNARELHAAEPPVRGAELPIESQSEKFLCIYFAYLFGTPD